ncbi:MAG: hypothetical protein LCH30_05750 [Proteobacteria bacterium]|nr:hypothetical protein [Pseudomonadota bacterium]
MKIFLYLLLLFPSIVLAEPDSLASRYDNLKDPKWEQIKSTPVSLAHEIVHRAWVPHGWIVITLPYAGGASTIFVPDENHEWLE